MAYRQGCPVASISFLSLFWEGGGKAVGVVGGGGAGGRGGSG